MMRRFCECLPEDRVIRSLDSEFDSLLLSDGRKRTYTVQSTQATLTYHSALSVLARYASSLVRPIQPFVPFLFLFSLLLHFFLKYYCLGT